MRSMTSIMILISLMSIKVCYNIEVICQLLNVNKIDLTHERHMLS